MKFAINSSELLKHLVYISSVIAANPILPKLENFLFRLKGATLQIDIDEVKDRIGIAANW